MVWSATKPSKQGNKGIQWPKEIAGEGASDITVSPVAEVVTIEMRREVMVDLSEQTAGMIQAQVEANTQMTAELKRAQDKAAKF